MSDDDPTLPLQPDLEPGFPEAADIPENPTPASQRSWEDILYADGAYLSRIWVPGGWLYRCIQELVCRNKQGDESSYEETHLVFVPRPPVDAHAAYIAQLDAELRDRHEVTRKSLDADVHRTGMRVPGAGTA